MNHQLIIIEDSLEANLRPNPTLEFVDSIVAAGDTYLRAERAKARVLDAIAKFQLLEL